MNPFTKRQHAPFILLKRRRNCETFIWIHKMPDIFQKARQFTLHFYSQKAGYFTLRGFSWDYWNRQLYIYTKIWHFGLREVFKFKKSDISKKSKDNLRDIFVYTKSLTLCVTQFFMGFLKLAEGGGFYMRKQCFVR